MNPQYQNIISPPPSKRQTTRFTPKALLLVGGILIAVLIAITLLLLGSGNKPVSQMEHLSARFETLQTILKLGTKNVKAADLKKVQSDASILVIGDGALINQAMKDAGFAKISKDITTSEADAATLATLSDAQLNGTFDTAYKKVLSQKLESTMALMREIDSKTNNKALKSALSTAYTHFGGLLDQLAKL